MKREEAIMRIKQNKAAAQCYAEFMGDDANIKNGLLDIEAFDMAIEALSADRYTEQDVRDAFTDGYGCGIETLSANDTTEKPNDVVERKNDVVAEPTDLISRADAIKAIEKYDFNFPEYMERFITELRDAMKEDLKDDIAALPSADRPTGEWIFNPKDAIELMFTKPKCSKCGFESADGGNFCSNCGAKMNKENEE